MANTIQSALLGSVAAVAGGASGISKATSKSKEDSNPNSKEAEVDGATKRAKDSLKAARKQKRNLKAYGKDMAAALANMKDEVKPSYAYIK